MRVVFGLCPRECPAPTLATWVLDYLALAACVAATGSVIPWAAVAVGYLIVQISLGLELTPGGTGPAEAGLFAALLSGGMPAGSAAKVVVVYRILTVSVLALLGWAVFLGVAMRWAHRWAAGQRHRRSRPGRALGIHSNIDLHGPQAVREDECPRCLTACDPAASRDPGAGWKPSPQSQACPRRRT